jgi:hypothetical protein
MSAQVVISNWKLVVDSDMVLRGQGADPSIIRKRKPRLVEIAEQALEEGMSLIAPVAVYCVLDVKAFRHEIFELSNGTKLSGAPLSQHLAPAKQIAAIVCTLGDSLEQRVSTLMHSDPSYAFALDGFGSAAMEALGGAVCSTLDNEVKTIGAHTSVPLSPGILGWAVDVGQAQIFSILDTAKIGVSLNDSAQMTPHKSISMVLGIGATPFGEGRMCDFCGLRETCRYQNREGHFGGQQAVTL